MDRVTNAEILRRIGEKRLLLLSIKGRKLKYFGHLIRAGRLQRLLLDGKVEGLRKPGSQTRTWMKEILERIEMNYNDCIRSAMDRRRWRLVVANLKNETAP